MPEIYKLQFQWLIQNEIKETENQIEQIVAHHGKGTYEEDEARKYVVFLQNILSNI